MTPIRLVIFDALHTLIRPRQPVHVQYSLAFAPYVGRLDPEAIKKSFKVALKALQAERPVYDQGSNSWWADVIRRTALGAGANETALENSLPSIVPALLHRFSSREGYAAFDDALPTLQALRSHGIRTAVLSNSDTRMRLVLDDLGLSTHLDAIVLSEEEGIEKPAPEIFARVLKKVNPDFRPEECLHVGDELQW